MFQQQVQIVITFLILLDGLVVIGAGYLAEYLKWIESGGQFAQDPLQHTGMLLFVMFVNTYAAGWAGLYSDRRPPGTFAVVARLAALVAIDFSLLLIGLYSLKIFDISRFFLLAWAAGSFLGFLALRLGVHICMQRWLSKGYNARRVIIAGSDRRAAKVLAAYRRQLSWGHVVLGYLRQAEVSENAMEEIEGISELGTMDDFERVLHERSVDEVVFVLSRQGNIGPFLELCEAVGVSYRLVPSLYDPDDPVPLTVERIQNIPTLARARVRINASGLMYKMLLDYVVGLVGVGFMCLMYPFVGLAIKLDSPGPILFSQPRMGKNRRVFQCYKFRTMVQGAEARKTELMGGNIMGEQMFKLEDDPRVTRVGRFLRKTSLDEFPQFINVLRGEMSVVGTRPPTLDETDGYEDWQLRRMSMKPGITGLWQVSGRNKVTDFDEVVKLDLMYIDNWRFYDDLKIIWKTIWVVLRRKGAI